MRTHALFISDAFPPYPGEEDGINPGIWGKRLAEFIVEGLSRLGVQTRDFYAEDWGWEIPVVNAAFPMSIGCSNQREPGGNEFSCLIEPSRPEVKTGFFKKVSTVADVERLADALEKVLRSHAEIRDFRWEDE